MTTEVQTYIESGLSLLDEKELEAERRAIEEEKRKHEEAVRIEQAKKEAAERARIEEQERVKREAEEKAERERHANLEAERQPDKEKLAALASTLDNLPMPEITSLDGKVVLQKVVERLTLIIQLIEEEVDQL